MSDSPRERRAKKRFSDFERIVNKVMGEKRLALYTQSEYQLVDLRDEIANYERKYRPFPPRSGSVSKPRKSTEPEIDFLHAKWAERGAGKKIYFRF